MAAVEYDEAARAWRGSDAALNFAHLTASRPAPASATSADDIRAAAPEAAGSLLQQQPGHQPARGGAPGARDIAPPTAGAAQQQQQPPGGSSAAPAQQEGGGAGAWNPYFLDEEALFETPEYLRNMAAGMMTSPLRFEFDRNNSSDDLPDQEHPSSDAGERDSLWSYRDS